MCLLCQYVSFPTHLISLRNISFLSLGPLHFSWQNHSNKCLSSTRNIRKSSYVYIKDDFNCIIDTFFPHFSFQTRNHGLTIFVSFQSYKKPPVRHDCLFDETLDFNDFYDVQHHYTPIAILLISRFSDSITVVKRESQGYVQFLQEDYSQSAHLSHSSFSDMIDTSSSILIFHIQVCETIIFLCLSYI